MNTQLLCTCLPFRLQNGTRPNCPKHGHLVKGSHLNALAKRIATANAPVTFRYVKDDGSERFVRAEYRDGAIKSGNITLWDFDRNDWRTFCLARIQGAIGIIHPKHTAQASAAELILAANCTFATTA